MTVRDGVCAYVMGGLGNQLFILAAAWEQSRRLNVPLYLDRSHFAVGGTFAYGLDAVPNPGHVLSPTESPWRSVRINRERVLPLPRRPWGRVYLERDGDTYSPAINGIRPGTTLVGYFQSPRYFPTVRDELASAMLKTEETAEETARIESMLAAPAITLHLRRGDYLAVSADRQFIASVDYAVRGVRHLRSMGLDHPVRVFSDSVDLVKDELRGVEGDFEFVEDDGVLGTWATLKAMSAGTAMIMSNSSFSWWGAELMRGRLGPGVPVIAPRPWTQTGTAKADLLEPAWVTLDAR
ncbi:alpha-1,2-fucosyltransferase [Microbacterium trichothecenolyticum]|uniref:Glycosyl transferase family 11 n=1 Tax=Microbacterium trichothecenolyticum TaxID=69370 RepID=A0A0M2HAP5_MICTR|nr:alpha-1,2-fucosyltransferase [Microbacterium trichothecenolyticum]KJL41234.1 Glycosyl transferase family 11 [Microbacterium trichothecenolyticum]